jgi:Domain of unknown function (DUF4402)
MTSISNIFGKGKIILQALGILMLLACHSNVMGQQKPPAPISVSFNPSEGLRFGAFFQSPSGGTVTINPSGTRSVTGGVIEADMGYVYAPANFEITANPGTLITIVHGPDVVLTGSSGGSLTLHLGSSYPSSPLITTAVTPIQTSVKIGGTLTVGNPVTNPSGTYSGTFFITFMQN